MRHLLSLLVITSHALASAPTPADSAILTEDRNPGKAAESNGSPAPAPTSSIVEGLADAVPPLLSISRDRGQILLSFTGTLQQALNLSGPWLEVTNATSPYQPNAESTHGFYRSVAASGSSIFSSRTVVDLTITGPLQKHFDLAFAGLPDGIFPPKREKPPFQGTAVLGGTEIPIGLRVRGFSSLQECPFPKLTLKVGKEDRKDTPFFDAREVKIATHCAEGGRGTIGRLRDERSTYREALAYEAMQTLGFVAPRIRRARIEFRDASPTNQAPEGRWTITRQAMLFDDPEVVGERMGGRALDDVELAALSNARFPEQLILDLRFLHILLGNWDYTLSLGGERLWNTEVLAFPDGTYLPMAGDFDLCSWVTEEVRESVPWDYFPERPLLERQMRYDLELLQKDTAVGLLEAAKGRFTAKQSELRSLVQQAIVDEPGRTNAMHHLDTFFGVLEGRPK
jgi:hypothetical protein